MVFLNIAGLAGEQVPSQAREAPAEDIADEKDQQGAGQSGAQPHQRTHPTVIRPAAKGQGCCVHVSPPSCVLTHTFSNTLMSMINRNSTSPME